MLRLIRGAFAVYLRSTLQQHKAQFLYENTFFSSFYYSRPRR